MRAAVVQMDSNSERERNLATAEALVRAAAQDGATLVALPERFDLRGTPDEYERFADHTRVSSWAGELAADLGIDLIAGSTSERREGHGKLANTSLHFGPDGGLKAVYRKVHLFDVTVGETEYRESDSDEPGDALVTTEAADGTKIGLSICYDVRFPELYRILALQGAVILVVPANFTRTTGKAGHWETLLRARAIENQAFVLAPAQAGEYPSGQPAYGHSMIVDPWGTILAQLGNEPGFVAADLDFHRLADVRQKLPSLQNRVPGAYRWPQEVHA